MDSIVLTGLDLSMRPERVHYEVQQGWVKPLPEVKVKHLIKSLTILVYNQMYLTPRYHSRVCGGRSTLAFFLCAVHPQQSPQSRTHSRQNSNSSQMASSDNSSQVICKSPAGNGKKYCELPKLTTSSMLPLGSWDGLYYALLAEIHKLHSDLQDRFGFGCENGTQPLHYQGRDGVTREPITAIDLASMLETAWYNLMDRRLVAALRHGPQGSALRRLRRARALGDRCRKARHACVPGAIRDRVWKSARSRGRRAGGTVLRARCLLPKARRSRHRLIRPLSSGSPGSASPSPRRRRTARRSGPS